jgi:hypothetical protein
MHFPFFSDTQDRNVVVRSFQNVGVGAQAFGWQETVIASLCGEHDIFV